MTTPSTRQAKLFHFPHTQSTVESLKIFLLIKFGIDELTCNTLQMIIEQLLSPLGFVVTSAMNGDEALDIIKSREYLPDLILLDVEMPGKTGYQVLSLFAIINLNLGVK